MIRFTGIAAVLIMAVFMTAAVLKFPGHINPLVNWISDLGSSFYNPQGAFLFNMGCVIAGSLFFIFCFYLDTTYSKAVCSKGVLLCSQITGFASGFSLVMVGLFSEDSPSLHGLFSATFFLSSLIFLILMNYNLRKDLKLKKLAYYGMIPILMDFLLIIFYVLNTNLSTPIFEWLTGISYAFWILLLAYYSSDRVP
jgi:hypothetical membrane protein